MPKIQSSLWFDTQAEDAANFYTSIFPNSKITKVAHYGSAGPRPAGTVLTVEFELDGTPYTALNGGPEFTFDEAISFEVYCKDQDEVDFYWQKLTADGGQEGPCGWLKDKFGLSWQIIPQRFVELLEDDQSESAQRAISAMLGMKKLVIADLEKAARG